MNSINDYTRQYWDEFTVFVENFDSLARIQANNGTIDGNFSICEGRFGNGGCFDGGSGYVNYTNPTSLQLTGTLTIEAWIKDQGDGWDFIVSKEDGSSNRNYVLTLDNNNYLKLLTWSSDTEYSVVGSTALNDNQWHHVAGVSDGQEVKIYLDGALENSDTGASSIDNDAVDLTIGVRSDLNYFFNGTIDEVRISKIARRPVSALWTLNYTLTSSEAMTSGLRHYWKVRALDGGGEQ